MQPQWGGRLTRRPPAPRHHLWLVAREAGNLHHSQEEQGTIEYLGGTLAKAVSLPGTMQQYSDNRSTFSDGVRYGLLLRMVSTIESFSKGLF